LNANELRWQAECFRRIDRGVREILDVYVPGWPQHVDPDLLQLSSGFSCMLGQLARNNMERLIANFVGRTNAIIENYNDEDPANADRFIPAQGRDYSLAIAMLESEADAIDDAIFDQRDNWPAAYGFNIFREWDAKKDVPTGDREDYGLIGDVLWRILTECWLKVLVQRRTQLGLS
jgi:hypothetical protein